MYDLVPLGCLAPHRTALVDRLVGRPEQVHRLEEIGLRAGTHIEVLQSGSPCIIRLASQRLCFRENELMGVLVRPLPLQAAAQVG